MVADDLFEKYYAGVFGDAWPALRAALLREGAKAPLPAHALFDSTAPEYLMDPASLVVARAVGAQPGEQVLDLCAAPGGKSMALIQAMNGEGHLVLNDASKERMFRLRRVILQRLRGTEVAADFLTILSQDGRGFGLRNRDRFDRVLLDAPCSGERHLLENLAELSGWTKNRTKGLAAKQYALLCSAMLALKTGGRLVYSTCALSPYENDGVIERFLKRKSGVATVITDQIVSEMHSGGSSLGGRATHYGWHFRPDLDAAWGPMYFCVLQKVPVNIT